MFFHRHTHTHTQWHAEIPEKFLCHVASLGRQALLLSRSHPGACVPASQTHIHKQAAHPFIHHPTCPSVHPSISCGRVTAPEQEAAGSPRQTLFTHWLSGYKQGNGLLVRPSVPATILWTLRMEVIMVKYLFMVLSVFKFLPVCLMYLPCKRQDTRRTAATYVLTNALTMAKRFTWQRC